MRWKKTKRTKILLPFLLPDMMYFFFFCFKLLFYVAVQPINSVVIGPGGQQRDSALRIHVSMLLQTPPLSRLPGNTEQSSLLYSGILLVIHFKYDMLHLCLAKLIQLCKV